MAKNGVIECIINVSAKINRSSPRGGGTIRLARGGFAQALGLGAVLHKSFRIKLWGGGGGK
jgi:hypothetical protein